MRYRHMAVGHTARVVIRPGEVVRARISAEKGIFGDGNEGVPGGVTLTTKVGGG